MATSPTTQVLVDGRAIKVTNLDKVMYPATGTTKGEVIGYYQAVAPWFLPHAHGRPATRKRWVHGVGTAAEPGPSFFNKNVDARSTPEWVRTLTIEHRTESNTYPLIDDAATLVWLAQLAALELHVPQWRVDADGVPQRPDRLVIDLDPGEGAGLPQCVDLAFTVKEILDGAGLTSVPVTSGSKGIHLYAALDGAFEAAEATDFARQLADSLAALQPDLVVSSMAKVVRDGKVFLDWSQNNGNKTTIAPYSLRGRLRPTVAAPRTWDELAGTVEHLEFTDVLTRLRTGGDPLAVLLPAGHHQPKATATHEVAPRRPTESVTVAALATPPPTQPPSVIAPMLATPGTLGDLQRGAWHYEVKWDGYRAIATVAEGRATFRSRSGLDFTATYPELAEIATLLRGHEAVLDGEIVALDARGRSSFEALQRRGEAPASAHYMVFDLLHLDGESWLRRPYVERRAGLEALLATDGRFVHVPATFGDDRETALVSSREFDLEGVIAKRPDSVYQPGRRSEAWLKIKHRRTQDVVVLGWKASDQAPGRPLGSLVLGVWSDGVLRYAGRAGSGFTDRALSEARELLDPLATAIAPVTDVPPAERRGVQWVQPVLVGEVEFAEWSSTGRLRHPVWRGWRPDVSPTDARRDG